MKVFIISLFCLVSGLGFSQEKHVMKKSDITTCRLIEKSFIGKNGKETGAKELYIRCSMQDYFIKICESEVTREELSEFIDRGIAVHMEVVEGEWDICPEDSGIEMQSRIGTYAIIHRIER